MPHNIGFHLSVYTLTGEVVYTQIMPPMPVPRAGETIFVPGRDAEIGWWIVSEVIWSLPSIGAVAPAMWVRIFAVWSEEKNGRKAPLYDEDVGWVPAWEPKEI